MVYDNRKIAEKYLKGWFTIDFLTTVPFDQIIRAISDSGEQSAFLRTIRIVRLVKLLRIIRASRIVVPPAAVAPASIGIGGSILSHPSGLTRCPSPPATGSMGRLHVDQLPDDRPLPVCARRDMYVPLARLLVGLDRQCSRASRERSNALHHQRHLRTVSCARDQTQHTVTPSA